MAPLVQDLNSLLDGYVSRIESFFASLDSTKSNVSPTTSLAELIAYDKQWQQALERTRIHQQNQTNLDALVAAVSSTTEKMHDFATRLSEMQTILKSSLETKETLPQVDYHTLLSYASKLAQYTSAPPGFKGDQDSATAGMAIHPPFPTEEVMRKGVLNMEVVPLGQVTENAAQSAQPQQQQRQVETRSLQQQEAPMDFFDLDLNPDLQ